AVAPVHEKPGIWQTPAGKIRNQVHASPTSGPQQTAEVHKCTYILNYEQRAGKGDYTLHTQACGNAHPARLRLAKSRRGAYLIQIRQTENQEKDSAGNGHYGYEPKIGSR
ncbi:MAG: hypothetical protein BJ554DRAFT_4855, partial [Olpidium bornovanus]